MHHIDDIIINYYYIVCLHIGPEWKKKGVCIPLGGNIYYKWMKIEKISCKLIKI